MEIARCPICNQYSDMLLRDFRGAGEKHALAKLQELHPSWSQESGLCERCLYLNEFDTIEEHFTSLARGTFFRLRMKNEFALLPTPLRLNADPRFKGRGVTIAFLDSGFHPHPDLIRPDNRIKATVDVTDENKGKAYFAKIHTESWHGTMTTVAATGNGFLSHGLYRGIAAASDVVLVKVMDTRTKRITTENIARGIRWAREHKQKYGIRIISISVGDDEPASLSESPVDQEAERAVQEGIVVVAAAGNSPLQSIVPPASSPSVITVGGLDDRNELFRQHSTLYHSTYGKTLDGISKPELIAPAIWVAGPILQTTDQYHESKALFDLLKTTPNTFERHFEKKKHLLPTAPSMRAHGDYKQWVRDRIQEMKYIAPYYKHVDGTSFAAPIVSSVIAQMLEAMPELAPAHIKQILTDTAEPLKDIPKEQQGFGVPSPRAAVERALRERHANRQPGVHRVDERIYFIYQNKALRSVSLVGDFNDWDPGRNCLHESEPGIWSCWIAKPCESRNRYKFVIDGSMWIDDPANNEKESDGFGGWNSRIVGLGPDQQERIKAQNGSRHFRPSAG
jgi:serine protease AprX